jgi:hypothetical protein
MGEEEYKATTGKYLSLLREHTPNMEKYPGFVYWWTYFSCYTSVDQAREVLLMAKNLHSYLRGCGVTDEQWLNWMPVYIEE